MARLKRKTDPDLKSREEGRVKKDLCCCKPSAAERGRLASRVSLDVSLYLGARGNSRGQLSALAHGAMFRRH